MGLAETVRIDDPRSLNRPAWDSLSLQVSTRIPSGLVHRYVAIVTTRGIFSRAYVVEEHRDRLLVRYVKKTNFKTGEIDRASEFIRKVDIRNLRVFKD